MNKTRIEWLHWPDGKPGYSWNPIKGLCPQACWYCYARKIYKRFNRAEILSCDPRPAIPWPKKPSRIFVCSTMELFHPAIPALWRDWIFNAIKLQPQHIFFVLTKRPENIDREMPENVWLGVSIEGETAFNKQAKELYSQTAYKKFISFEPLLGQPELSDFRNVAGEFDWIIIGRLTGHGNQYRPAGGTIMNIVDIARQFKVPIFLKNNLSGIWPGKLVQEFPK